MVDGDRAVRQFERLVEPYRVGRLADTVDSSNWELIGYHVYDHDAETVSFERCDSGSKRALRIN